MDPKNIEQNANPSQEASLFQTPEAPASPAVDDSASYEILKGENDSEFYKVPKADFEEMQKGVMRADDYTRGKQTLQGLSDMFAQAFEEKPVQPPQKPQQMAQAQQPVANQTRQQSIDPQKLQQVMENMTQKQIQQQIEPLVKKLAADDLDKEDASFRQKYSYVLSGDQKQDTLLMNKVYETAMKYTDTNGVPVSLETAFHIAFGGNMIGALQKVYAKPPEEKNWGTESSGLTKPGQNVYRSTKDADFAVEQMIKEHVGYNN